MRGIDISHYQQGLDVGRLNGCDFVILKLTEGAGLRDAAAFGFYRAAWERGLPAGGYCYSHAKSPAEAEAEARFLLETVKGFPLPCGVFLDIEEPETLALPRERLREIALAWCNAIRAAGYVPGLYGSEYALWAKLRKDDLPEDALVWVAHYGREPEIACDLWQAGDNGRVEGYDGPVDVDFVRSERFREMVTPPQSAPQTALTAPPEGEPPQSAAPTAPPKGEPSASVAVLQLLMRYRGCGEMVDGRSSAAFYRRLREMIDEMEAGQDE